MAPIKIKIKSSQADLGTTSDSASTKDDDENVSKDSSANEAKSEKGGARKDDVADTNVENPDTAEKMDTANDGDNNSTSSQPDSNTDCDKKVISEDQSKPDEDAVRVPDSQDPNSDLYEYEGDDVYYTNPSNKVRYKWDSESGSWVDPQKGDKVPPSSSERYQYEYDGNSYFYRTESGTKVKWNQKTEQWEEEEEESEESEEDDNTTEEERKARQYRKRKAAPGWSSANTEKNIVKDPETGKLTYRDEKDGTLYEFDENKRAWFPCIGEEFMATYQLNYGFTNDLEAKPTMPDPEPEEKPETKAEPEKKKMKKEKVDPKWFVEDEAKSTKVYVSGLPEDITEESFEELMSKCGMVEHDIRTKKAKLKIYRDAEGNAKGDGLCSYIKPESVQLALTIIDGSEFKGKTISVQRAKFEMKGEAYNPKLKPKKLNKRELEKQKKQREKLFAWIPDKLKGERFKHEKVIVIKNLFEPAEFDVDPGRILDYTSRIRDQCKKFGTCTKVVLYDKHEEGICQVFFREPEEADMAKELLHGRLFGKRIMTVDTWDGKAKYKKEESKEEEEERLAKWEKFLSGDADEGSDRSSIQQVPPTTAPTDAPTATTEK